MIDAILLHSFLADRPVVFAADGIPYVAVDGVPISYRNFIHCICLNLTNKMIDPFLIADEVKQLQDKYQFQLPEKYHIEASQSILSFHPVDMLCKNLRKETDKAEAIKSMLRKVEKDYAQLLADGVIRTENTPPVS